MSVPDKIKELRARIDVLDQKIQDLLNERVGIAQNIARAKASDPGQDFYRPEREAQVLRDIMQRNTGPLPDHTMAVLFREIMSATLAAESPITIAYLGPAGTYSQAAAIKHFGKSATTLALSTVDDVFRAVEKREVGYAVVPVENSTEGGVTQTLDAFIDSPLKVCGEVHVQIEEDPANTTRFLVIGSKSCPISGHDRTSLLISSNDSAGALPNLLAPLAEHGIAMSQIESRPTKESVFFIDIEGHQDEPNVSSALAELGNEAAFLKILGAYPRSVL